MIARAQIGGRSVEEVRAEAMAAQSIKAMIDPKDIAALAVFLASDAAKSISGQVLPIDNDQAAGVMVLGARGLVARMERSEIRGRRHECRVGNPIAVTRHP